MNSPMLPNDKYQIEKLVFVNSGNSAYVVLPLHESTALVVDNNQGKSSTLGALKLILLPEENMHKCESKFSFQGKDGFYTGEQSHKFYFPTDYSYIIAEISNPASTYCQILHRGRGSKKQTLAYERWFVPCSYDDIEHHFFNGGSDSNYGIGEVTRKPWQELPNILRDLQGKNIKSSADLREFLYNPVNTMASPLSRYAMLPLAEKTSKSEVKALKALLDLAFNMSVSGSGNESEAISSIIDRRIATNNKTASIDLGDILRRFEELRKKGVLLDELRGLLPKWERAHDKWKGVKKLQAEVINLHQSMFDQYHHKHYGFEKVLDNIRNEHSIALNAKKRTKQDYLSNRRELDSKETLVKESKKRIENLRDHRDAAKHLRGQYSGLSDTEIAETIQYAHGQGIFALEERLKAAQSDADTQQRLEDLKRQLPNAEDRIQKLEDLVKTRTNSPFANMPALTAAVIAQVLPDLTKTTGKLSSGALDKMNAFAGLFDIDSDPVRLEAFELKSIGKVRPFDIDILISKSEQELQEERKKLSFIEKDILEQMRSLKDSSYRENLVTDIEKDLYDARLEKDIIERAKSKAIDLKEELEKLELLQAELGELAPKVEVLREEAHAADNQESELRAKLEKLQIDSNRIKEIHRLFNSISVRSNGIIKTIDELEPSPIQGELLSVDSIVQQLDFLMNQIDGLNQTFASMVENLATVIAHPSFTPVRVAFTSVRTSISDLVEPMEYISGQFEAIEEQKKQLRRDTESFNHFTGMQISFIDELIKEVNHFESLVNKEFEGMTVSNLENVQIQIEKDASLKELTKQLQVFMAHQRTDQTVLPSESFFSAIQHFCTDFFDGNSKKIQISSLIKGVKWKYDLNGVTETKSQSHGTSGVLNATLVAFMLRQLISDDIDIRLPIVFDEVGSLGDMNFKSLRNEIEKNGFILLVANPNITGSISAVMGTWIDLGHWKVDKINTECPNCILIYNTTSETLENHVAVDRMETV